MCPRGFRRGVKFSRVERLLGSGYLDALNRRGISSVNFSRRCRMMRRGLGRMARFIHVVRRRSKFPSRFFFSIHPSLGQMQVRKVCLSRRRLFSLHHSLRAVHSVIHFLRQGGRSRRRDSDPCPDLGQLTKSVTMFPRLVKGVSNVLGGCKGVGSGTSARLTHVHERLTGAVKDVSHSLGDVLHDTRSRKCMSGSMTPAVHSNHLIVPITPNLGHGVGKVIRSRSTDKGAMFVRPTRIMRTGGHIHRLRKSREQRVVHVLARFSGILHPSVPRVLRSCRFLTRVSFVHTGDCFTVRAGDLGPTVRGRRLLS